MGIFQILVNQTKIMSHGMLSLSHLDSFHTLVFIPHISVHSTHLYSFNIDFVVVFFPRISAA
jgi:hypothetical protein